VSFGYCIAKSETETRQTHVKFVLDLEEVHTMDKSNTKRFEVKFVLDLEEVPPAGIFFGRGSASWQDNKLFQIKYKL